MLSSFGAFQDNSTITPDLISKVAHDSQVLAIFVSPFIKPFARESDRSGVVWTA